MENQLAEAKAALSRMADGADEDGDIRAVIGRLEARAIPPVDDVREALTEVVLEVLQNPADTHKPFAVRFVDAVLADLRIEVRPRGTVTKPSDADILAGLNAEGAVKSAAPSLDFYGAGNISRMRNVLKGAAEARS